MYTTVYHPYHATHVPYFKHEIITVGTKMHTIMCYINLVIVLVAKTITLSWCSIVLIIRLLEVKPTDKIKCYNYAQIF